MKHLKSILYIFLLCLSINSYGQTSLGKQAGNTVRVMSYNIRNGYGTDEKTDLNRIANIIRKTSPDVVALQELDSTTARSKHIDVLTELSNMVKMYAVYGASIHFDGGKYGIGILSKIQPVSWKRIPLPGREEARSLLMVEFPDYWFCCTHFSLTEEDRLASADIINKIVANRQKPVILAGDLNDTAASAVLNKFSSSWRLLSNSKMLTYPADKPEQCIDYIIGYTAEGESYTVLQNAVLNEPLASDHRPIVADIRFKVQKENIFRTMPYLQNLTNDGVTVAWHTNVPCHSWVEYGIDSTQMQKAQTLIEGEVMANNTFNKIRIKGLKSGTRYYYRICSKEITLFQPYYKEFGETAYSRFSSFTTWNPKQTDFTTIIFNDLHEHYATYDKLCSLIKDIPYNLVVFNGDCITDIQEEINAVYSINYYGSKYKSNEIPAIYLRGNHEIRGAYSVLLSNLFESIGEHSYGAFSIGDTRFVMLDCGEDKPDNHWVYYGLNDFDQYRKEQINFLQKEITSKEFKSASKRILIHHIPTYGKVVTEEDAPCRRLWGNILEQANFDVCLNGHMHEFEYLPKGKDKNAFPVVVGGGPDEKIATVTILSKKGKNLNLKTLDSNGKILLELNL